MNLQLQEAFGDMAPVLKDWITKQKISFQFNPPSAQHFSGACEREVRSVKTAHRFIFWEQSPPVLHTLLVTCLILLPKITDAEDNINWWTFSASSNVNTDIWGRLCAKARKGYGPMAPPTGAKRILFRNGNRKTLTLDPCQGQEDLIIFKLFLLLLSILLINL